MTLCPDTLELCFEESDYGLSARRLWEHTELGQINVFSQPISARRELNDAATFIDVVWFWGDAFSLAGFTLADLRAARIPEDSVAINDIVPPELADSYYTVTFEGRVADHLDLCSMRRALRNLHPQFLPTAQTDDAFGVPHMFSTLLRRLQSLGNTKAGAEQWQKTIANFQQKGLRTEELDRSKLMLELPCIDNAGNQANADDVVNLCNFEALRLSVIPVVKDAQQQLRFSSAPDRTLKRAKKLPKAQTGQSRAVAGYDHVLGYRIEQVEHQTLWGTDAHWQAVTHDGQVIRTPMNQTLLSTAESAKELATGHAKLHFPKRIALGRWGHIAWSGGEEYREWLITLPYYPASYFSSHFNVRNVLAHVRCDVRQGADGERILLLQEVQSDWAQNARRAIGAGTLQPGDEDCPPFLKEWPTLAMKLVLLHAAHQRLDAVAWTLGAHQVSRYKGLGAKGLTELYDRSLPREVNRMIKSFGGLCAMLEVFVPTNFSIRQSEDGYEVYTAKNAYLGTAATLEDARHFVPDGAHELLYEVHGVRLPQAIRKAILETGFSAWG
ncbi:MAG: hypothetical protein Q7K57_42095 [Burkholderiaceae bacterium]|nr:hypothetical protein [Burkholderiaceae bacterium]